MTDTIPRESGSSAHSTTPVEGQTEKPTVARIAIPAREFVLAETLQALPEATVRCDRIVESGDGSSIPLIWVRGTTHDELEAAFAADASVETASLLAEFDDRCLYRMTWESTVQMLVRLLTNDHATILDIEGDADGWSIRVLYPSRNALSTTLTMCERHNFGVTVEAVYELEGEPGDRYGLTPKQHEALTAAHESGYFAVPRSIDLMELSSAVGVSHQALSERLRRGHVALIENALLMKPRADDGDE